jgi:hypothetical protein
MIYKPHCHLARHAFSPKSGNLRDSQTMKAQMAQAQHLEEMNRTWLVPSVGTA